LGIVSGGSDGPHAVDTSANTTTLSGTARCEG
jgi:hypothetical protein